jgi:hypothetical protein
MIQIRLFFNVRYSSDLDYHFGCEQCRSTIPRAGVFTLCLTTCFAGFFVFVLPRTIKFRQHLSTGRSRNASEDSQMSKTNVNEFSVAAIRPRLID